MYFLTTMILTHERKERDIASKLYTGVKSTRNILIQL